MRTAGLLVWGLIFLFDAAVLIMTLRIVFKKWRSDSLGHSQLVSTILNDGEMIDPIVGQSDLITNVRTSILRVGGLIKSCMW